MNVERIADGFSFLEGPRWQNGELYASDFYTNRVLAFDSEGAFRTVCEVPGQPSGLGFTPDGEMLVVSIIERRLFRVEGSRLIERANFTPLTTHYCNDMCVDGEGRAYVGTFAWEGSHDSMLKQTAILTADSDGRVAAAADGLVFPNGMALANGGRRLLVAETFAARISAFDVSGDGSLSNRRVWAEFAKQPFQSVPEALAAGVPLPDGIAIDSEGALWVGDAAGRAALRIEEGGRILERREAGDDSVYAVALGGRDLRTLFMCAASPMLSNDPATDHMSSLLKSRVSVGGPGH